MRFSTPRNDVEFEIPDEWWTFAEMNAFSTDGGGYYPYPFQCAKSVEIVELVDVEPPSRNDGVPPFKKCKLVPVLLAFTSPECALPPVEVEALSSDGRPRYRVVNGYHRYYASVAAGYTKLPVTVRGSSNNAL
jgi:hypothetical protein